MLIKVIHITKLPSLFYGGALVCRITFDGPILYQAVIFFNGKKVPLVF